MQKAMQNPHTALEAMWGYAKPVEVAGIEPTTFALRTRRSPN